jgi:hypothetical protein
MYLHGEGFAGSVLAHTHTGTNPHLHSFSGTTGYESVGHTHAFSGTTTGESAPHTHAGNTNPTNIDLSHSHSGVTAPGEGAHTHNLLIHGSGQSGFYIVHRSGADVLEGDGGPQNCHASMSVTNSIDSNHQHDLVINTWPGNANHAHAFTTNPNTGDHSHNYSGSTQGESVGHTHNITGTTSTDGSGLGYSGVSAGTLPTSVRVYIDGIAAPGSWTGQFSTGAIDLSSYIADTQEHAVEIREEGGTGGQVIYTLFVE